MKRSPIEVGEGLPAMETNYATKRMVAAFQALSDDTVGNR